MAFVDGVLTEVFAARKTVVSEPNVDTWRYPPPRNYGAFSPDTALKTIEFLVTKRADIERVAARLHDEHSRSLLRDVLVFRTVGASHKKLPTNNPSYWQHYQRAAACWVSDSDKTSGPFKVGVYRVPFMGQNIEFEGWLGNAAFTFFVRQYFFERSISIKPQPGDYVIDAGACFGDTGLAFAAAVGPSGKVFSFDPLPEHGSILTQNMQRNPAIKDIVSFVDQALWSEPATLKFMEGSAGSRVSNSGIDVKATSIDTFVSENRLPRIDFIKMDIETAEVQALTGAADTIRRFKPKLAISVYHRLDDILTVPETIEKIQPGYRFFLDHYTIHAEETVLYGIHG